jgi:hypothetical protein
MSGPIDYIIVGFEGNKFDGSILTALGDAIDSGVIDLVSLFVVSKDSEGVVTTFDVENFEDEVFVDFIQSHPAKNKDADQDDIDEVADLIENNCTAGLLVIEHLWAKPLKKAIIDANGVLLAEGRIHPEAMQELDN